MINHKNGKNRPTYFTIKDDDILCFIPLSNLIIEKKIKKYGECKSIMISEIGNKKSVILLQNAFPTLEKYMDHPYMIDGKSLKVIDTLKKEILDNFKYMMALKKGRN